MNNDKILTKAWYANILHKAPGFSNYFSVETATKPESKQQPFLLHSKVYSCVTLATGLMHKIEVC